MRCLYTSIGDEPTTVLPGIRRRAFLLGPPGLLLGGGADAVKARPAGLPIPLAEDASPDVHPAGFLVSEKYDGVRAVWDGERLRFRSGLLIEPPRSFIERLPSQPLDGELWLGRGRFEDLSAAVRRALPREAEWRDIRYMVFDLPGAPGGLAERCARLQALVQARGWPALQAVEQQHLPDREALQRRFAEVLALGGEGLMLRRANAPYAAGRSAAMLKLKPMSDAEALVLAHEPGRGRHAGRLGALRVRSDDGQVFRLGTGFTDTQRAAPPAIGSRVTFAFRGRTADGVPRFASFVRERAPDW